MKILYFDIFKYSYNKRIHSDSIQFLEKYEELITLGNYISSKKNYKFEKKEDIESVIKKEKPDCLLTYNPASNNVFRFKEYEDVLKNISIPKFHISTDYCRGKLEDGQKNWFKKMGYSAAMFRHKIGFNYECSVDKYSLPFSVDKNKFIFIKNKQKNEKVGFVGSYNNNKDAMRIYEKRIKAMKYFEDKNIMDNYNKSRKSRIVGEEYIKELGKNWFGLTCSGTCNFLVAKHFEIPATNSILLCDGDAVGLEDFPKDSYISYGENILDAHEKILELNGDHDARNRMATRLHEYVMENHNHDVRAKYLIEIMGRYI